MKCPHYCGNYLKSCSVSKEPYVPSAYEAAEYCSTGLHTMCPLFRRREFELPFEKKPVFAGMGR